MKCFSENKTLESERMSLFIRSHVNHLLHTRLFIIRSIESNRKISRLQFRKTTETKRKKGSPSLKTWPGGASRRPPEPFPLFKQSRASRADVTRSHGSPRQRAAGGRQPSSLEEINSLSASLCETQTPELNKIIFNRITKYIFNRRAPARKRKFTQNFPSTKWILKTG